MGGDELTSEEKEPTPEQKIENYRLFLERLHHDDDRKAHLFAIFLAVQGALLVFFSWSMERNETLPARLLAALAIALGVVWFLLMERLRDLIAMRVEKLKNIERILPHVDAMTAEEELREKGEVDVGYPHPDGKKYRLHRRCRLSIRATESYFPLAVSIFWIVILLAHFARQS
jgi:hypothetical protein